ncbi:ABC transporter substrate-binding protein [Alsobacter sp. R-9]
MDRRVFLAALAVGGCTHSSAYAEETKVLGWLTYFGSGEEDLIPDTMTALGRFGWRRGTSLVLNRSVPLKLSEVDAAATELVGARPALIVVNGEGAAVAVRARSDSQPILFYNGFDPVRAGVIQSLAKPGGQTTGLIAYPPSLGAKWLQVLQTLIPSLKRVAVVFEPTVPAALHLLGAIKSYSSSSAIEVANWPAGLFGSLDAAAAALAEPYPQAIIVVPDPITIRVRRAVTQFALQRKIPTMFWYSDAVRTNALISYGPDRSELPTQLAVRINRLLRGDAPSSIPAEEPSRYEMAINRLIATQMEIDLPPLLSAQADVIVD